MKRKMQFLLLVVLVTVMMISLTANAEPLDYTEIIIDENTPYSTVLNMINEEPIDEEPVVSDGKLEGAQTNDFQKQVVENQKSIIGILIGIICFIGIIAGILLMLVFWQRMK